VSRDDAVELLAIDALTYRIITIGDAVNDRSAAARDAHSRCPGGASHGCVTCSRTVTTGGASESSERLWTETSRRYVERAMR